MPSRRDCGSQPGLTDAGIGTTAGAGVGAAVGNGIDTAVGDESGKVVGDGSSTVVGDGIGMGDDAGIGTADRGWRLADQNTARGLTGAGIGTAVGAGVGAAVGDVCGCRTSERAVRARERRAERRAALDGAALPACRGLIACRVDGEVCTSPRRAAARCRAAARAAADRASALCAREHAAPSGGQPQTAQRLPLAAERVDHARCCSIGGRVLGRAHAARAAADRAIARCAREPAAPSGEQPLAAPLAVERAVVS